MYTKGSETFMKFLLLRKMGLLTDEEAMAAATLINPVSCVTPKTGKEGGYHFVELDFTRKWG